MNNPAAQFREVLIDGQAVTIPTLEEWENLMHEPVYLGSSVYSPGTKELVNGLRSFTAKHRDQFCLGMYRSKGLKSWLALPLLRMGDSWQRVQIEHVSCDKCDWRGVIANPAEPSLYFGVPNELAVIRSALMLPHLGCPNCGASLSRTAIWMESVNGVSNDA
jgi:hypothetical protein